MRPKGPHSRVARLERQMEAGMAGERADAAIQRAAMALGLTDEWTDQETMIADFEARFGALRARVAQLEAALREARCFLENELEVREMAGDLPNSEYIDAPSRLISRIDAALAQPAESGAKPGAVGGPSVVSLELPGGHPAEALPLFELEDGLHEKKEAGDGRA